MKTLMKTLMRTMLLMITGLLLTPAALAGHAAAKAAGHAMDSGRQPAATAGHIPHGANHLSVLLANTHVRGDGDSATVGIDYEYRVSPLLGLGAVLEYAFGELSATTLLAVADIHLVQGLVAQVGPGFERRSGEDVFVARVGLLYEFEYRHFTLSPQLHWDYHAGESNAIVAGVAIGLAF